VEWKRFSSLQCQLARFYRYFPALSDHWSISFKNGNYGLNICGRSWDTAPGIWRLEEALEEVFRFEIETQHSGLATAVSGGQKSLKQLHWSSRKSVAIIWLVPGSIAATAFWRHSSIFWSKNRFSQMLTCFQGY